MGTKIIAGKQRSTNQIQRNRQHLPLNFAGKELAENTTAIIFLPPKWKIKLSNRGLLSLHRKMLKHVLLDAIL